MSFISTASYDNTCAGTKVPYKHHAGLQEAGSILGPSSAILGYLLVVLGHLGISALHWEYLGPHEAILETSSGHLGPF